MGLLSVGVHLVLAVASLREKERENRDGDDVFYIYNFFNEGNMT